MTIFIDDAIRKLIEIKNDGYSYCDIDFIPEDEYDGESYPAWVSFTAVDGGGEFDVDYNDGDEENEVNEISEDELAKFAFRNHQPAPNRKAIKTINISD